MCVSELNVSLLPCRHRWYRLLRSCSPENNLYNCPSKVVLEGWEQRRDFCPWCSAAEGTSNGVDLRWHRLIGNDRNPSKSGLGYLPRTTEWESSASDADDERENSTATHSQSTKRAKQRERSLEQKRALAAYLPPEQANLNQEQAMLTVGANDPLPYQPSTRAVVKELVKKGSGGGFDRAQ